MEPADRGEVDRIVKQLHDTSGGVRDLIHLVVQIPLFATKGTAPQRPDVPTPS